ncbi:hypothetical protein FQR65_LT00236 [Abscondita terminalis]|nr:hypothetical protein FQR65_LT00236 [Abscondita terminalis]
MYSNLLTDEEIEIVAKLKNNIGRSFFEISGADEDGRVRVEPSGKVVVKLAFGELSDADDRRRKKKKVKDEEVSSKSSESTKSPKRYYVTKYNLIIGSGTFVKDIILIGTFK